MHYFFMIHPEPIAYPANSLFILYFIFFSWICVLDLYWTTLAADASVEWCAETFYKILTMIPNHNLLFEEVEALLLALIDGFLREVLFSSYLFYFFFSSRSYPRCGCWVNELLTHCYWLRIFGELRVHWTGVKNPFWFPHRDIFLDPVINFLCIFLS